MLEALPAMRAAHENVAERRQDASSDGGQTGRPALDHRRFLEAVLWLARTGSPWRDLPPELMNWRTAWRRLQRWTAASV